MIEACPLWIPNSIWSPIPTPLNFDPCFFETLLFSAIPAAVAVFTLVVGICCSCSARSEFVYSGHISYRLPSSPRHLNAPTFVYAASLLLFIFHLFAAISRSGSVIFFHGSLLSPILLSIAWAATTKAAITSLTYYQPQYHAYFCWPSAVSFLAAMHFCLSVLKLVIFAPSFVTFDLSSIQSTIMVPVNFVLFLLAYLSIPRFTEQLPLSENAKISPEAHASILSLAFFTWFSPMIRRGSILPLESCDLWHLYPPDECNSADSVALKFYSENYLKSSRNSRVNSRNRPRFPLWSVLWRSLWWHIFLLFLTGLCGSILSFSGPVTLNLLISHLEADINATNNFNGIAVVFAMFCATIIRTVLDNSAYYRGRRIGTRMRSVIISRVFDRAMYTRSRSLDPASILSFVQTDATKIVDTISYLHYIISAPMQITIAIIALHHLIGPSAFVGLIGLFCTMPINTYIGRKISNIQEELMKLYDARVAVSTEVFSSIRTIKFFAWEPKILLWLSQARTAELSTLRKYFFYTASLGILWYLVPLLILIPSLFVHTLTTEDHKLPANTLFTTIALFATLKGPLLVLPMIMTRLIDIRVSLKRIQNFLDNIDDIDDIISIDPGDNVKSDSKSVAVKDCDLRPLIFVRDASFTWDEETLFSKKVPNLDLERQSTTCEEETPLFLHGNSEISSFFMLENISAIFPPGKLTVIIGKTGSGRSSLLQALLGEMPRITGVVCRPERVSYVPQISWLFNGSLRENILIGSSYNPTRLKDSLFSCGLDRDILELDGGYHALVGEKGQSLSGGQRSRVDLCRAVYSYSDVVLMDDIFSALDATTSKHVFETAILGIMRRRTCILVTNALSLVLPKADHVIFLKDGKIVLQGTPEEALNCAEVQELLLLEQVNSKEFQGGVNEDICKKKYSEKDVLASDNDRLKNANESFLLNSEKNRGRSSSKQREVDKIITDRLECSSTRSSLHDHTISICSQTQSNKTAICEEERSRGSVSWRIYFSWINAAGGLLFFAKTVPLLLIQCLLGVFQDLWLREWSKASSNEKESNPSVFYYMLIYLLIVGSSIATVAIRMVIVFCGALRASRELSSRLVEALVGAKIRFYDITPLGRILNRLSRDLQTIDKELPNNITDLVLHSFQLVSIAIIAIRLSPLILAVSWLLLCSLFILLGRKFLKTSRELKRIENVSRTPIFTIVSESIHGAISVRAYKLVVHTTKFLHKAVDDNHAAFLFLWASNRWLSVRTDILGAFSVAVTGLVLVLMPKGAIDSALAGLTLTYVLGTTDAMMWVIRLQAMVEMDLNSVERVTEWAGDQAKPITSNDSNTAQNSPLSDNDPQNPPSHSFTSNFEALKSSKSFNSSAITSRQRQIHGDKIDVKFTGIEQEPQGGNPAPHGWPRYGSIDVFGLTARYDIEATPVLQNLTFKIMAGFKVAVCGRTGAGKTSLARALLRFVPYCDGSVIIDGIDISSLALHALRSAIAIVPQEPVLFTGTIRSNLDLFGENTDLELSRVLGRVGLTDRGVKLNDEVRANGSNYCCGTRQLIALARALLCRSKVLILDEATSSVDAATDSMMQTAIRTEFKGCTILTIAHRLSTIVDYDRVLVLDQGSIVQYGPPSLLAEDKNGIFYAMCEQSGDSLLLFQRLKQERIKNQTSNNSEL